MSSIPGFSNETSLLGTCQEPLGQLQWNSCAACKHCSSCFRSRQRVRPHDFDGSATTHVLMQVKNGDSIPSIGCVASHVRVRRCGRPQGGPGGCPVQHHLPSGMHSVACVVPSPSSSSSSSSSSSYSCCLPPPQLVHQQPSLICSYYQSFNQFCDLGANRGQ